MKPILRVRFWVEAGLAATSGLLGLLTVVWREWIEGVTRLNPDHGNGSLEWSVVTALVVVCAFMSVAARVEWRRPTEAAVSAI